MTPRILIVEDDELLAGTFQRFLQKAGYGVDVAVDYVNGKQLLMSGAYSAIFMDIHLQGQKTGMDLLREIREIDNDTPVVIITGAPEIATAAEAVRKAAFDYLCKPVEKEMLLSVAGAAVSQMNLINERKRHQNKLEVALNSMRETIETVTPVSDLKAEQATPRDHQESALSRREQQILAMLGQGESKADIAAAFAISVRTVETYFARIIVKLKLSNIQELKRFAIKRMQK